MKICILYDTRRGSTQQIVEWMQEALLERSDLEIEVLEQSDVSQVTCDLLIIGCPIYFERPKKEMRLFIEERHESLNAPYVAVFILGWAKRVYDRVKGHVEKNYFGPLIEPFKDRLIGQHMFRGWIRKLDPEQEYECKDWICNIVDDVQGRRTE
jgi:menaquinone-dependent protoporphyrinogen oxidase